MDCFITQLLACILTDKSSFTYKIIPSYSSSKTQWGSVLLLRTSPHLSCYHLPPWLLLSSFLSAVSPSPKAQLYLFLKSAQRRSSRVYHRWVTVYRNSSFPCWKALKCFTNSASRARIAGTQPPQRATWQPFNWHSRTARGWQQQQQLSAYDPGGFVQAEQREEVFLAKPDFLLQLCLYYYALLWGTDRLWSKAVSGGFSLCPALHFIASNRDVHLSAVEQGFVESHQGWSNLVWRGASRIIARCLLPHPWRTWCLR